MGLVRGKTSLPGSAICANTPQIPAVFAKKKPNRLRLFALQEDTFGLPALQHIYNGVCNPVKIGS